jgi:hypothetical protein
MGNNSFPNTPNILTRYLLDFTYLLDLGGTTFGAGRGRQVAYLIFVLGVKTGVGNIMGLFNQN